MTTVTLLCREGEFTKPSISLLQSVQATGAVNKNKYLNGSLKLLHHIFYLAFSFDSCDSNDHSYVVVKASLLVLPFPAVQKTKRFRIVANCYHPMCCKVD